MSILFLSLALLSTLAVFSYKPPLSNRRIPIIKSSSSSRLFTTSPHLPVGYEKVKYDAILEFESSVAKSTKALNAVEVELTEVKEKINKVDTEIDKISAEIEDLTANEAVLKYKADSKIKLEERRDRLEKRADRFDQERRDTALRLRESEIRLRDSEKELSDALGKHQIHVY